VSWKKLLAGKKGARREILEKVTATSLENAQRKKKTGGGGVTGIEVVECTPCREGGSRKVFGGPSLSYIEKRTTLRGEVLVEGTRKKGLCICLHQKRRFIGTP